MVLKYSRLFAATGAVTREPVTIRVELIEASDVHLVSVETLEGEYSSPEDFDKASGINSGKIHNFIPLTMPSAKRLNDALTEALGAAGARGS